MRDLKVLVFPCGSEIGLEIRAALDGAKGITLYGGSSINDHGELVYRNYIGGLPRVEDGSFLEALNAAVREHSIDYIFPAHDSVVLALAEAASAGRLACKLLASPVETCRVCRSKKRTYEALRGALPVPEIYDSQEKATSWPAFVKPDIGNASRGVVLCETAADAAYQLSRREGLLLCEYLPGKEYTVDCFTAASGELVFCGGRLRERISGGISVRTRPVSNPEFLRLAGRISSRLKFRGPWFFQLKEAADGSLKLLEAAPRVAGAMGLYRALGVNFPLMAIYDAEGFAVKASLNNFGLVYDRALGSGYRHSLKYKCAYLDWDDCLVQNGRLNIKAVAFVYQCLNNGVKTVLLTRHTGDIPAELRRWRLPGVFEKVISVPAGRPKSAFIEEREAVFIDDSFAERREVLEKTGVPVFAPDAIDCLLEP